MLRDIVRCRTAALGGHLELCEGCGYEHPVYNSCRNRHCPKCQCLAAEKWIMAREARVLPTRHFHVVFTLPAELRRLARYRPTLVFDMLFAASAATLQELARDERHLGAELAITSVLHTWTRDLRFHPHVHCIVTGGGLSLDGARWMKSRKDFLFPVQILGTIFRGKMLDGLRRAHARGDLDGFDDFEDPEGFDRLMQKLASHKRWNVYAKKTFRHAEHVFAYLGRYTHRVGIANSRLISLVDGQVTFRTKDSKTVTLAAEDFLARFVAHVLPRGFVKIRHYGLLAAGNVNGKLVRARELLEEKTARVAKSATAAPAPTWAERLHELTGRDVRRCPRCGAPLRSLPLPDQRELARAPP